MKTASKREVKALAEQLLAPMVEQWRTEAFELRAEVAEIRGQLRDFAQEVRRLGARVKAGQTQNKATVDRALSRLADLENKL